MNVARQGCIRPGNVYSNIWNVNAAIGDDSCACPDPWKCDCQHFKLKCPYPHESCNKRNMDERIAFASARATIDVLENPLQLSPLIMILVGANLRGKKPFQSGIG